MNPISSQSGSSLPQGNLLVDAACVGTEEIAEATGNSGPATSHQAPIASDDIADLLSRESMRNGERKTWRRPAELIPISLDGTLYAKHRFQASTLEISAKGISLQVAAEAIHVSQAFLLSVHTPNDGVQHNGVIVQRVEKLADRTLRCGCVFGGPAHDVVNMGPMMPEFSQEMMAFVMPPGPALYDNWVDAGIASQTLIDRVLVCPKCTVLPTFRNACRKCQSGRVTNDRLVHHFTCAYVGHLDEFQGDEKSGLTCPKCRVSRLIVGSDYEYLTGEYRCLTCGWRDSDIETVGHCLKCSSRFDLQQARELELYRYDVRRLAPLAVTAQLD